MNLDVKRAKPSVTEAFAKPTTSTDKSNKPKQRDLDEEALIERVSQKIFRAIDDKFERSMLNLKVDMQCLNETLLR